MRDLHRAVEGVDCLAHRSRRALEARSSPPLYFRIARFPLFLPILSHSFASFAFLHSSLSSSSFAAATRRYENFLSRRTFVCSASLRATNPG